MKETRRFGRIVPLPSTAAIKNQIVEMGVREKRDIPSANDSGHAGVADPPSADAARHA